MNLRDEHEHEWQMLRCRRCGVWLHGTAAKLRCRGERHPNVEESWRPPAVEEEAPTVEGSAQNAFTMPSVPLFGSASAPLFEPAPPTDSPAPAFESTAFSGGESGGGGSDTSWDSGSSSSVTAEAPDTSSSFDSGNSYDSGSSSDSGGSSFDSGGGGDSGSGS